MLLLQPSLIEQIKTATKNEELLALIQGAVELEFSTIPPYLAAMLSLKPGMNRAIWNILHSVVIDEMLHMAIGCNLMTALGGGARIDNPDFVPKYPTHLSMAINSSLVVPLQAYSEDTVRNVFMKIESPETPLVFPAALSEVPYATIGQFYRALADRIRILGSGIFVGDPKLQLDAPTWFGNRLQAIQTPEEAIAAIDGLVEEGEGTMTSPLDAQDDVAHYYRFEQLLYGHYLVRDAGVPQGFAYRGDPIPFDPQGVFPITPNQTLSALPEGSQARRVASQFAFTFTKLLKALHRTFNGAPQEFDSAMGLMFELRLAGQKACSLPYGDGSQTVGPVFEYVTHSG